MTQSQRLVNEFVVSDSTVDAARIPALSHKEAEVLAHQELDRFLAVVETLRGEDWQQPTDCTAWTVRDIVAHQAGAYAGYASWGEFRRQMSAKPGPGQMQIDGINARQLADRAERTPAQLITELRTVGPQGIRNRSRVPWLLRKLPIPFGPPLGTQPVAYLTDLIYTRDTWSHRLDICRATDRPFKQTPDHDGRMMALVLRDLAHKLEKQLRGQSVIFDLVGPAGGRYRIGSLAEPTAILKMDALDFNRRASDRLSAQAVLAQGLVSISGDRSFAQQILAQSSVPY